MISTPSDGCRRCKLSVQVRVLFASAVVAPAAIHMLRLNDLPASLLAFQPATEGPRCDNINGNSRCFALCDVSTHAAGQLTMPYPQVERLRLAGSLSTHTDDNTTMLCVSYPVAPGR